MSKTKVKGSVFNLTLLGVFIALILMFTFSGIGYIPLGFGFTVTVLPIVVAVGATLLRPTGGAVLGFVFGLTSLLTCVLGMDAMGVILFGISPWRAAITCIIPRVLVGLFTGLIFTALQTALQKIDETKLISFAVACICCPLLNTLLFLSTLWLCFGGDLTTNAELNNLLGGSINGIVAVFTVFAGVNGIVEAIATTVVGTPIAKALAVVKSKVCGEN